MKELNIQAEVGRRLREVIGRAHAGHALRVNRDARKIDELIASGKFTSKDANALRRMHADTIHALHKKFVGDAPAATDNNDEDEEIEDVTHTHDEDDEEVAVMANLGRTGKALERQNQRHALTARAARMSQPRYFQRANGIQDAEAEGMVPPTHDYRKR